jgi:hypothetical protein
VEAIQNNDYDEVLKDDIETTLIATAKQKSKSWPKSEKNIKIEMDEEKRKSEVVINATAHIKFDEPSGEDVPTILEGNQLFQGRKVLFRDKGKLIYPPNNEFFESWGCVDKFDKKNVK